MITQQQAQKITQKDAQTALGDLEAYKVDVTLQFDGWHVDYILKGSETISAQYVVDEDNGEVTSAKHE